MKEYEYNGFTYKEVPTEQNERTCDIIHDIAKPESIYKFYSVSNFSVEALKLGYLYASHPYELNDTLDSSIFLIGCKQRIDYSYYKQLLGQAYRDEKDLLEFYESENVEGYYSHGYIKFFWDLISNIFGVISLIATDKNELMWPHYTQEKGYQIKFNTGKLEASVSEKEGHDRCHGLFPINYTEKLNPIDFSDFPNPTIPFFYATNVKSSKWEYEQEWRFLISKQQMGVPNTKAGLSTEQDYVGIQGNRRAFYDRSLVEEITLGHAFFTQKDFEIQRDEEQIITIKPLESENHWNFKNYTELLDYIHTHLSDKLFHSGRKYEFDEDGMPYLTRTKERMEIKKVGENRYELKRTNEFY
jgi:hypothetical protein